MVIKCSQNLLYQVTSKFPSLNNDIKVEITIVGGEMTEISCAYQLLNQGYKVAIIEKDEIGSSSTRASSGVLYYGTGINLGLAMKLFWKDNATLFWNESAVAINEIVDTANKYKIDCGLRECGAIMIAKNDEELDELKNEKEELKRQRAQIRLLLSWN